MNDHARIAGNALKLMEEVPLTGKDIPATVEIINWLTAVAKGHLTMSPPDTGNKEEGKDDEG